MPNVNRDCKISVRLTKDEKAKLQASADAAGLRVVEYVRSLIFQEINNLKSPNNKN